MKREIKFRAWDKKDKLMYHNIQDGILFEDGSRYDFYDFLNNKGYHEWEIMQYIGLKDKEGKEIFEGDIIEKDSTGKNRIKRLVLYKNGAFRHMRGTKSSASNRNKLFAQKIYKSNIIVIGNIFENPELLEKN